LISLLFVIGCKSQPRLKEGDIRVNDIGWTINFPKGQVFQNTKQIDSLQKITFKKLHNDKELEGVPFKTIFSIVEGFNGFNSSIERYNSSDFISWPALHAADKNAILESLESLKANSLLKDSTSSYDIIDGVRFETFTFKL